MHDHPTWVFLSGLGIVFSLGFVVLTVAWAFLVLRVRERADEVLATVPGHLMRPSQASWNALVELRAGLAVDGERVVLVAGSVPVLALIGTVLGFFFALSETGHAGLGASDPLVILKTMLNSGMDTALATTVAGQALYFLMTLAYGAFVTGRMERADVVLNENLALMRSRIGRVGVVAVEEAA